MSQINEVEESSIKSTIELKSNETEHASLVAEHYNQIQETGLIERFNSPIFYLRNFNNWIKTVLIQQNVYKLQSKQYVKLCVLDICCGKGGDIGKWRKANVKHVIFADIADVSVQQCQDRYQGICKFAYTAEFIVADCTRKTIRDKYRDPSIKFDLASCQFGLHYSFESLSQARRMLSNISECIRPDGFFIGTIPDANEIIARTKESPDWSVGNGVYKIKLLFDPSKEIPLFGAKYDFHLEGVVDCPEFLVNFKLLIKLAEQYGLQLVYKGGFEEFYKEHYQKYSFLLHKIKSLETYPPPSNKKLIADESEYNHAKNYLENMENKRDKSCVGTMSKCEWEVATVYMVFVFKKMKSTLDANGRPVYSKPTEEL